MANVDSGVGPTMPSSPEPSARNRRNWIIGVAVIVVMALIIGAIAMSGGNDNKKVAEPTTTTTGGAGEIFLQPASDTGPNPFTDSTAGKAPASTIPADTPVTLAQAAGGQPAPTAPVFKAGAPAPPGSIATITALSGGTPGLYGGTLNQSSCDKQQLIDFLAANADKAQAWADVQSIAVSDIAGYINALTPVQLRSDTRVTNHGFSNGHATEHQDVLQAGTAVLVDQYGVPRARCACGNPLLPPRAVSVTPAYQGTPWTGFNPGNVTVIAPSPTVIKVITLINITNGKLIGRSTGKNPGPDRSLPGRPAPTTTTTTTLPPFTPPGVTLPPLNPPPVTLPPLNPPPVTPPPATAPPTTAAPSDFVLVSSSKQDGELAYAWTTNKDAGTATEKLNDTTIANYHWTVPQRIKPSGTNFTWGGDGTGNINVLITPRGEGISFNTTDLTVNVTNTSGEKSALVTPTAAQEVKFIISMGYGPTFTYVYRR